MIIRDYATKVFGFATFGRIYGVLVCISGLLSFGQSGLDALTLGPLGGNPLPVNIVMAGSGTVLGTALAIYLWVQVNASPEVVEEVKDLAALERMPLIGEEEEDGYGTTAR